MDTYDPHSIVESSSLKDRKWSNIFWKVEEILGNHRPPNTDKKTDQEKGNDLARWPAPGHAHFSNTDCEVVWHLVCSFVFSGRFPPSLLFREAMGRVGSVLIQVQSPRSAIDTTRVASVFSSGE